MWKVLHKLFGWDYISWKNTADNGIARVVALPDGTIGYWRYKNTKLFDVINELETRIVWLTCPRSKYIMEQNQPPQDADREE